MIMSAFWLFALIGVVIEMSISYAELRSAPSHALARFREVEVPSGSTLHKLVFAVKQRGVKRLKRMLELISNHTSPSFGLHLTHIEIAAITDCEASADRIEKYLHTHNIAVGHRSLHHEYITATASLSQWDELLGSKFRRFARRERVEGAMGEHHSLLRTSHYSIPIELKPHVHSILYTNQVLLHSL